MKQVLVYGDSLSWGIIPDTRRRLPFAQRWPGVMQIMAANLGRSLRVMENCLNGRRTAWDDPYKPGRNALHDIAQVMECHAPLDLLIIMLGTNDFQSMHPHNAWHSAQGMRAVLQAVRQAPIEPGMPQPPVLIVSPPAIEAPKGLIAPKFVGGEKKCLGLAQQLHQIAEQMACDFFDAAELIRSSAVDGVHLDQEQHQVLGEALARYLVNYSW